jgi:hypothetical protein
MPFGAQYIKLIESQKIVPKTSLAPKNIYKISTYEYADGTKKSFSGTKTSIVFVIGIYDKKISCLKISEMPSNAFFNWLKSISIKNLEEERIDELQTLDEILIRSDRPGNKIFNSYIKSNTIYNRNPNIYRTYIIKNIGSVSEIKLKKEVLMEVFDVKKKENTEEVKTTEPNNP